MTTGQRIKAARKKAGLTQKELGEKLGVAYQTLAQWENDLRNPKYETIQRIAVALNIGVFSLLDETGKKAFDAGVTAGIRAMEIENSDFRGYSFSETEYSLIDAFSQLNGDGQQKAVERVEELTEIPRYRRADAPAPSPEGNSTPTAEPPEKEAEDGG